MKGDYLRDRLETSQRKIRWWTEERNDYILRAHKAGWTLREIAAEVGLSPEGVNKILKRILNNGKDQP